MMKCLIRYRRGLFIALLLDLIAIGFLYFRQIDNRIPDKLLVFENDELELDYNLPVSAELEKESIKVFHNQESFNFREPIRMQLKEEGHYLLNLKLFGFIHWKDMEIQVVKQEEVIPSGIPVGIYVKTDGLLVLGTGIVTGEDGLNYEPALNIVKTGDYIETVNGEMIDGIEEFQQTIEVLGEKELTLGVRREGTDIQVKITPVKGNEGKYRLGIWVRQDTQGIGTLTYYTEKGEFGALGHGITDSDTGELIEIKEGKIYQANIVNIIKGTRGEPGELVGYINRSAASFLGILEKNTTCGIFGEQMQLSTAETYAKSVEIAPKQEIKVGKATVLCQIEGELKEYEIEIEKLRYNMKNVNKGMVLKITDPELLGKTNGIVQGMSGSPIIQDGKLVGAVTHVLVNDPTRGYGIFIENMLDAAG